MSSCTALNSMVQYSSIELLPGALGFRTGGSQTMFRRPIAHRADVSSYTLQRSWGMPLIFALRKQVPVITVDGAGVCRVTKSGKARRSLIRCLVEKTARPRLTLSSLTGCGMHGRPLTRSISVQPGRLNRATVRRITLAPPRALPAFAVRKIGPVTGLAVSKLSVRCHFISHLGPARPHDGRCGQFFGSEYPYALVGIDCSVR